MFHQKGNLHLQPMFAMIVLQYNGAAPLFVVTIND